MNYETSSQPEEHKKEKKKNTKSCGKFEYPYRTVEYLQP